MPKDRSTAGKGAGGDADESGFGSAKFALERSAAAAAASRQNKAKPQQPAKLEWAFNEVTVMTPEPGPPGVVYARVPREPPAYSSAAWGAGAVPAAEGSFETLASTRSEAAKLVTSLKGSASAWDRAAGERLRLALAALPPERKKAKKATLTEGPSLAPAARAAAAVAAAAAAAQVGHYYGTRTRLSAASKAVDYCEERMERKLYEG